MSRWWRAHEDAVDNPKLQRMPGNLFKAWFNLMCLASRNDGALPPIADIAFGLRKTEQQVTAILADLRERKLVDEVDGVMRPHDWDERQFKTDTKDPTNAERQKRFRRRYATVTDTVTVTDTRAETEQSRADAPESADQSNGQKYAFESGVIRLTAKDFSQWKEAFSYLDLPAELTALAPWAGEQQRWFHAVSGALGKRNREEKARRDKPANGQLPLTPSGNKWPEGIV